MGPVSGGRAGRLATMAVTASMLAACGPSAPTRPSPPVTEVSMREYAFDYTAPSLPGRAVFHITNAGHIPHRLALVLLTDDIPEIRAQLRGTQRRFLTEIAGIPDRPPGADGTFAVNLLRGRYAFICFTMDADGVAHGARGMAAEFRIR